jgi:putative DNA primase/helicase
MPACAQKQVIAALRERGLWLTNGPRLLSRRPPRKHVHQTPDKDDARRTVSALALWQSAEPARGTLVETYLASRSIDLPSPDALRFHSGLKHPCGSIWPAMVALVTNGVDGSPLSIHRTFIAHDGGGKAPVDPEKMSLGPCRGGVVRLGPVRNRLMIAEGIETALSAMQATGQPAWAALSAAGLRALELPPDIVNIVVLADGDEPGEAAARDAAQRWKREGRCIRIARPPHGLDFNDVLGGRLFCDPQEAI